MFDKIKEDLKEDTLKNFYLENKKKIFFAFFVIGLTTGVILGKELGKVEMVYDILKVSSIQH